MISDEAAQVDDHEVSSKRAVMTVLVIVPLIVTLFALARLAGVADFIFLGFLFITYWTGIKNTARSEFMPALMGSMGGLALAFLIHALPAAFGLIGSVAAGAGVCVVIYLLIRQKLPLLINNAFLIILTVTTSFAFKTDSDYAAAAISILLAALYSAGLVLITTINIVNLWHNIRR